MQEFEKLFVQWTIAQIKKHRKPVKEFIRNLKAKNLELGNYAQKEAFMISPFKVEEYGRQFQQEIVRVCNATENPQKTAQDCFKAMNLTPEMVDAISKGIKGA